MTVPVFPSCVVPSSCAGGVGVQPGLGLGGPSGIYRHRFKDLREAIKPIAAFIDRYNREWIVARLGYKTPARARADFLAKPAQPTA